MATYYSPILKKNIRYNARYITETKIQEIIDFNKEYGCALFRIDYKNKRILRYSRTENIYFYNAKLKDASEAGMYALKMYQRIEKMFWKAEIGEK